MATRSVARISARTAVRLARLLAAQMPEPEALGLLALMLFHDARREARTAGDGSLVLLEDQNRSLWNKTAIAEGRALIQTAAARGRPGPYQIQAAIAAVHTNAATAAKRTGGRSPSSTIRWSSSCRHL